MRHPSDQELIRSQYGVTDLSSHLTDCAECRGRVSAMRAHRQEAEAEYAEASVDSDFLYAQRRRIYQRLSRRVRVWQMPAVRRFATVGATGLVVASGLLFWEHQRVAEPTVSDTELAQDVSRMSQDLEAQGTAPLEALFE